MKSSKRPGTAIILKGKDTVPMVPMRPRPDIFPISYWLRADPNPRNYRPPHKATTSEGVAFHGDRLLYDQWEQEPVNPYQDIHNDYYGKQGLRHAPGLVATMHRVKSRESSEPISENRIKSGDFSTAVFVTTFYPPYAHCTPTSEPDIYPWPVPGATTPPPDEILERFASHYLRCHKMCARRILFAQEVVDKQPADYGQPANHDKSASYDIDLI